VPALTVSPQLLATQRLLEQEQRWRAQAEALTFDAPDPTIARRHLLEFIRLNKPSYLAGWFHRELCAALEQFTRDVAARRSPRLLIAAPPRHGKSEIVSRQWPVWHLGKHPDHEVVVSSYGQDLANDMSRDARAVRDRVLEEPAFGWGHLAPGDKDGVELWRVAGGGSYNAVGVGGPLVGRGAHILVLDDPLKNMQEADSEVVREARWRWYASTAYTRLHPGGGVLIMATRWNEDDPSGRALAQLRNGEEPWQVVSYPALAEEDEPHRKAGEPLHPERYDLEQLTQIRTVLGSRAWNALYQQRPTAATGGTFQRAWLGHRFAHDPKLPPKPYTEIVMTVDATFTDTEGSAYVSLEVWGRIGWETYDWLDDVHARMAYSGTRQAIRDLKAKWPRAIILIEAKANGPALIDELRREFANVIPFVPDKLGSKEVRAELAAPTWEAGCCRLPAGAAWAGDAVEELASFPAGTYRDRVDTMTQLFIWWASRRDRGTDVKNANLAGVLRRASR